MIKCDLTVKSMNSIIFRSGAAGGNGFVSWTQNNSSLCGPARNLVWKWTGNASGACSNICCS